jgi:hypothetical protein
VPKNFPVVRSSGLHVLLIVGTTVTAATLLWMHQMRVSGELHGLAPIFFVLFAYNDYSGAACALLVLLGAIFASPYVPAVRVLGWVGKHPVVIAVISVLFLAVGTRVVYHDHPLSMDEYAAYFQSRVFAAGHLNGDFPPPLVDWLIPRGFQEYFLNASRITGSVAETYWPGFALLLTPFTWADIPWVCNPVISALTLLVIHRLALVLFNDREAAGLALMLTIASPVIFANGISYYSMPAHLLANSLFALLLIRPSPLRAFAAGVVGSFALSLHNPVPHALFAAPWLIWIATRQDGVRLLTALCVGYLPLCILLGVGWFMFSAHMLGGGGLVTAAGAPGATDRLQGMLSIFSLPKPTVLLARLIGVAKIWIWAVPGLLILAGAGAVRWRQDPVCRLLTTSALLTVFGYFFVPVDQGHGWGYRYFHSAWMALPLLATAAMFRPVGLNGSQRGLRDGSSRTFEDSDTKSYVTTCIMLTLIFGIGWRAWQMQEFVAHDLSQLPQYTGTERQVVIIDGTFSFYGADLVQNDPWLREAVIRMYSHGTAADAQMMANHYPTLHRVYADRYGTVWSEASAPRGSPATFQHQGRDGATSK